MPSTFDIILLVGAFAGLLMIAGGILLIYRGAITLQATPKADALTVRWRKQFVISTQVPALGFFLIGLAFVVIALWFARPVPGLPLVIRGDGTGVESEIRVAVRTDPWELRRSPGIFEGVVNPNLEVLIVDIAAPGYEPDVRTHSNWIRHRIFDLGTINLKKTVSESDTKQADVERLPFASPPLSDGSYGVAP